MEFEMSADARALRALIEAGRFQEAGQCAEDALQRARESVSLLREAGLLACVSGDFSRAATLWGAALRAAPKDDVLRLRLADLFCSLQRFEEALTLALEAWRGSGGSFLGAEILSRIQGASRQPAEGVPVGEIAAWKEAPEVARLSAAGLEKGREALAATLEAARKAVGAAPDSHKAWMILGLCAQGAGCLEESSRALLRAYELRPGADAALLQFGVTLSLLSRKAEAATCFLGATRLNAQNADAFCRLGWCLLDFGQNQEALAALYRASALKPKWGLPLRYTAVALLQNGQPQVVLEKLRVALEFAPGDAALHSQLLSTLHYIPVQDHASRIAEFEAFAQKFEAREVSGVAERSPALGSPAGRRIRVGYVSGDFRRHSVAFFVEPLLKHHDREGFEIFCYMSRSDSDEVTERIRAADVQWRRVDGMSEEDFAALVRRDAIDVLVDLSNHTAGNRLLAFVQRPAPVQVTMVGLHHTTGLRSIGYRITDAVLDPPGEDTFNTETLVRLSSGPMVFEPPPEAPEVNALPCTSGQSFTFAYTNDMEKVNASVIALWARILRALPESRLLFFSRPGNRFLAELAKLGISARRVLEVPRQSLSGFLQAHHDMDLVLDPFPYNGLTVTLLSAWMGVPSVALSGKFPPARASECVLRRLGLSEFVVHSEDAYVQKAVAVASDPARLAEVRKGLRERVRRSWCDGPGYVRELEEAFRRMLGALPGKAEFSDPVR